MSARGSLTRDNYRRRRALPLFEFAQITLIIRHEPRRNGWPERVPRHLLAHELIIRGSTARAHAHPQVR
jgi:hypothetical protein